MQIKKKYVMPDMDMDTWTTQQVTAHELHAKVVHVLYNGLSSGEFFRVHNCTTAFEIWHTLEVTNEGTSQVKESKMVLLSNQLENFKIIEGETLNEMYTRFTNIINSCRMFGKNLEEIDLVR